MSTVSTKVHFIKSICHKPLCGRGRFVALASTYWREVTCARCLRVKDHGAVVQKRKAAEKGQPA